MALKFTQKGGLGGGAGGGGTYDHTLLINRGMPDQHTIESITGLRDALNRKYEKPFSGIPKNDLGFDVATLRDLQVLKNTDIADLSQRLQDLSIEVYDARGNKITLKEYIDSKVSYTEWSGAGGVGGGSGGGSSSEVGYPLYEYYTSADNQTVFPLQKTYQMGTHQLEVYLNGLRMLQGLDYEEKDDHTIEFLYPLELDDQVLFMVRAVINSGLHEEYVAAAGQTTFILKSPYGIYQNILQVYQNGILLRKGRDYQEINDRTIELIYPTQKDDLITFHQAGATDPLAGTVMESEIGRVKINQAYTVLALNEATNNPSTDYMDMYVDTFITTQQINEDRSLSYEYINQGVEVGEVDFMYDEQKEFSKGTFSETDGDTYLDLIRLNNTPGGAELNNFLPYQVDYNTRPVDDGFFLPTKHKSYFYFLSEQMAAGTNRLLLQLSRRYKDQTFPKEEIEIAVSTGYFFGMRAAEDSFGNVHLVYHEQGGVDGISKAYYAKIQTDGVVLDHRVVSNELYDAITPDVTIDKEDRIHIVFSSKRIHASIFNVDYLMIEDGIPSGLSSLSASTTLPSINPSLDVGNDNIVRVVFETSALTGTTKNIKLIEITEGVKTFEQYLTISDTFDNVMPRIKIDSLNTSRVVWRSKRLSPNFGVDYCSVLNDHTVSSVRAIKEGTDSLICGKPDLSIDYEDISHVVFHANEQRSDQNNIMYGYVYPDNQVMSTQNIAYEFGVSFSDPEIVVYGDEAVVSYVGGGSAYSVKKSLRNFTSTGRYDLIVDSYSQDTKWTQISAAHFIPASSSIDYEYRISNDKTAWTVWNTINNLPSETELGRYIQIRATLTSSQVSETPEIYHIQTVCEPNTIYIESVKKPVAGKAVSSAIVIANYTGNVKFEVSRDGGVTFVEAIPERSVDLSTKPAGQEIVLRAVIEKGSRLESWGIIW